MSELTIKPRLEPEDVEPEAVVIFADAGQQEKIPATEEQPEKPIFEIGVKLPDGRVKQWTMNKTSQRAVAKLFGYEPKQWLGKSVTVQVVSQNVRGTMKKVIYVKQPEQVPIPIKPVGSTAPAAR